MALTYSSFITKFPDLATITSTQFDTYLENVNTEVLPQTFGSWYNIAAEMLMAHLLTINQSLGSGEIVSENLELGGSTRWNESRMYYQGELRQNYMNSLTATKYGREYFRIKRIATGASAVMG